MSLLVICVQEPELTQEPLAASALSDICKHSPELAQAVNDAGATAYLAPLVTSHDSKLKRQVRSALGQTAKHSVDPAEVIIETEIFPKILTCRIDVDVFVRKNMATVIREICKHMPELGKLIVSSGSGGAIVVYVNEARGTTVCRAS